MDDTQIATSLQALPRVNASPAFTRKVLLAIHSQESSRRRPFVWRMAAAFAMVVCLVAIAQIAVLHQERARIETLRAEQQKLAAELREVKQIAAEAEPVVVLENDKGTQIIVDYDTASQLASHRPFD